jgi:hypothetical protein
VCVVVLQVAPAGLPAQSAFVRHPTQSPVVVLHTSTGPSLAQSALVVHLGWHWPAQNSLARQSVSDEHRQSYLPLGSTRQVGPAGLPAQSALVTQPTQRPVDVLQAVP